MNATEREKASRIRQEMTRIWREMGDILEEFEKRAPLVKGTVYQRRRRCGQKGCRCSRGQPHVSLAFSYSEGGKTKHLSLRGINQERLKRSVEGYRRFRSARAQLAKTCHAMLDLVDEMESLRRIEFDALLDGSHNQ